MLSIKLIYTKTDNIDVGQKNIAYIQFKSNHCAANCVAQKPDSWFLLVFKIWIWTSFCIEFVISFSGLHMSPFCYKLWIKWMKAGLRVYRPRMEFYPRRQTIIGEISSITRGFPVPLLQNSVVNKHYKTNPRLIFSALERISTNFSPSELHNIAGQCIIVGMI